MTVPGPEAIATADDPLAPIAGHLFRSLGVEGSMPYRALRGCHGTT
jgi:hypothetical protein